jgi:hypothetical protein
MQKRGPKDWNPRDGAKKKLKARALDNHGHEYAVWLSFEHSDIMGWKWILGVEDTPGHWYMSTLLENGYPRHRWIAIDCGQDWNIVNFDQVMKEAVDLI